MEKVKQLNEKQNFLDCGGAIDGKHSRISPQHTVDASITTIKDSSA